MADPPPAYQATTVEPGQLDHPTHLDSRVPFEDTMQDARLDHVSRIGEAGLVATGRFAENDTILIAPAALCRTREISLGELRGQYEFTCSQHRVDAVHAMAAVMQVYENGPFQRTSGRAFSPCMSISYMMSLLTDSPSPDVKQLIDEFQTTYLADAEDGLEDNSTVGHDTSTTDPGYEHSLEACAMRALRFLDGALVAEDLDICHLVYANFTAYINHGCVPNAILITELEEKPESQSPFVSMVSVRLKALRPIAPGDEITVSYHHGCIAGRDIRRMNIRDKLGFLCRCYHCVSGADEETLTHIGTSFASLLYGRESDLRGQAYHRQCRRLFAAFQRLQLTGWQWRETCMTSAYRAVNVNEPDFVRVYYFIKMELDWCEKWLGQSHVRTKEVAVAAARLRQNEEDVAAFANISWEFMLSDSAQRVFFLDDSPPKDRVRGEHCIQALRELQNKERRQKKNLANRKNRQRKKANKPKDNEIPDDGTTRGSEAISNEAVIPANAPESPPEDNSTDTRGLDVLNEGIAATSAADAPCDQSTSLRHDEGTETALPDPSISPSAAGEPNAPSQDVETQAQSQTPTTASPTSPSGDTSAQNQEAMTTTGSLATFSEAVSRQAPSCHFDELSPADNAIPRPSSPHVPQGSLVEEQHQLGHHSANVSAPSNTPSAASEDAVLPALPEDETPAAASSTPDVSTGDLNAERSLSVASTQGLPPPNVDIAGSGDTQALGDLPPMEDLSLNTPSVADQKQSVASEDDKDANPTDTFPGLEEVQSSSDEEDYPDISTPTQSSEGDGAPDQRFTAASPQEPTSFSDSPPQALLQVKQKS